MNFKSDVICLVPGCLLCPRFQAEKKYEWQEETLNNLSMFFSDLIQMPCPEATFQSSCLSSKRKPHGIQYYQQLPGFIQHCRYLAEKVAKQITLLHNSGYEIGGILGVEQSPSCAATYMYTNKGTIHRKGIFIECLIEYLNLDNVVVELYGVNRKYPHKLYNTLKERNLK